MNKEELIKYQQLLKELKKEKIYRNIDATCTSISLISFFIFSNAHKYKYGAISAFIAILGINALGNRNDNVKHLKRELSDYTRIKK